MKVKKIDIWITFISIAFSILVCMLAALHINNYILIGIMGLFMLYQVCSIYLKKRNIFDIDIIFIIVWLSSLILSLLKLHPIQIEWSLKAWFAFMATYASYFVGSLCGKINYRPKKYSFVMSAKNIELAINIAVILVIVPFTIEVMHSGIPAFSSSMSAYMDFSLPIIHYFTVSCVLIPPLVIYYLCKFKVSKLKLCVYFCWIVVSICIPILIVSRQLIILSIVISVLTYYYAVNRTPKLKNVVMLGISFVVFWIFISSLRNQDENYLNANFEYNLFKIDLPLSIKNIYSYVAWNFDNFNHNINYIDFKYGRKFIEPFLSFFGARKFLPSDFFSSTLVNIYPTYTTVPITYTGYQDFGLLGVVIYMIFIGYICYYFKANAKKDIFSNISYSLCVYGITMSFFTSFFSSTNFWGYLLILQIIRYMSSKYIIRLKSY